MVEVRATDSHFDVPHDILPAVLVLGAQTGIKEVLEVENNFSCGCIYCRKCEQECVPPLENPLGKTALTAWASGDADK